MSGGSWDYVCYKIDEAADNLIHERCPERRALGHLMHKVGKAMHDIEWVDSGAVATAEEELEAAS